MKRPRSGFSRSGGVPAIALLAFIVVWLSLVVVERLEDGSDSDERHAGIAHTEKRSERPRELPSLLPDPRLSTPIEVWIVRDPASRDFYESPATLDSVIALWEFHLRAIGARPRVVAPAELTLGWGPRVLVVPASPCLSVATRALLERVAGRAHGLIVTGLTGTRDEKCRIVGYAPLVAITGALRIDTLATIDARDLMHATIPADVPLSIGIPPGSRLDLSRGSHVALRHPRRDAFYSTPSLTPRPARKVALLDGAIVHHTIGRGHVVYWGFDPHDVVPRPWNIALTTLLIRNSVAWAARLPMGAIASWPNGHHSAAVIAQDVEEDFENARHAVDSLRAAGVRGTYFLVSGLAERHRPLVNAMAENGEIGTHTTDHRVLRGHAAYQQTQRLRATQRSLHELTGDPVEGLRPPEELFDLATLGAWLVAGGSYVFGVNDGRAASPELVPVDGDTIVLLPRVINDDFISVRLTKRMDPESLAREYLAALEKTRALGGLSMLSYHSQLLSRPELVPALARVARSIDAKDDVWLATAGEVAEWWLTRARLDVSIAARSASRLVATVENNGTRAVEGAVLQVVIPEARAVRVARGGTLLERTAEIAWIGLPRLAAGDRHTVTISLVSPR